MSVGGHCSHDCGAVEPSLPPLQAHDYRGRYACDCLTAKLTAKPTHLGGPRPTFTDGDPLVSLFSGLCRIVVDEAPRIWEQGPEVQISPT